MYRIPRALLWLTMGLLLIVNIRIYSGPPVAAGQADPAAEPTLLWLDAQTRTSAPERMQALFPEGLVFTHALTALAWTEWAMSQPPDAPARAQARAVSLRAIDAIASDAGRAPFPADLSPPHGPFWAGWLGWVKAGALMVQPEHRRDPHELASLAAHCSGIEDAYATSNTPFLPSYPGQAWPVDSVVAVSLLSACESLGVTGPSGWRDAWLSQARPLLDVETGLFSHTSDPRSGAPTSGPRGTSTSVILRFLHEIDPALARTQYEGFRAHLLTTRAGLPAVLEFPGGDGEGDIDSGPLIWGASLSATAVGAGVARIYGDDHLADGILGAGEGLGWPITIRGHRRYLGGLMPVADGFAVWARTARTWVTPTDRATMVPADAPVPHWRAFIHLISALLLLLTSGFSRVVGRVLK